MSGTGALGQVGAACLGITVGYLTYRSLVRTIVNAAISALAAMVAVIGGAAVTGLFAPGTSLFGWYSIGLLAGLAAFFAIFGRLNGLQRLAALLSVRTEVPGDGKDQGPDPAQDSRTPGKVS